MELEIFSLFTYARSKEKLLIYDDTRKMAFLNSFLIAFERNTRFSC